MKEAISCQVARVFQSTQLLGTRGQYTCTRLTPSFPKEERTRLPEGSKAKTDIY
jgi:hypothetical protein